MNLKYLLILLFLSTTPTVISMEENSGKRKKKKIDNIKFTNNIKTCLSKQEALGLIKTLANTNLKENSGIIKGTIAHAPEIASQAIIQIVEIYSSNMSDLMICIELDEDMLPSELPRKLTMELRTNYINPLILIIQQTLSSHAKTLNEFIKNHLDNLVRQAAPLLCSESIDIEGINSLVKAYKTDMITDFNKHFKIHSEEEEEEG